MGCLALGFIFRGSGVKCKMQLVSEKGSYILITIRLFYQHKLLYLRVRGLMTEVCVCLCVCVRGRGS